MIHNHIPFCLEVKGVPRFEWLKSEKGNPKEFPKITRIPQGYLTYFMKKNA